MLLRVVATTGLVLGSCAVARVAIICCALRGRRERGVGIRDSDEAFRGVWIARVAVWVVEFGEGVELSISPGKAVSIF
jgi:hypothetical protein